MGMGIGDQIELRTAKPKTQVKIICLLWLWVDKSDICVSKYVGLCGCCEAVTRRRLAPLQLECNLEWRRNHKAAQLPANTDHRQCRRRLNTGVHQSWHRYCDDGYTTLLDTYAQSCFLITSWVENLVLNQIAESLRVSQQWWWNQQK